MITAILLTILMVVLTYPGAPLVFAVSAISAYGMGEASRIRGNTGCLPALFAFVVFAAYIVAVAIGWGYLIHMWLDLGL